MDRESFKAFEQARKSMSDSESRTNTSSAATDAASGSPKRYAHGSEIGVAVSLSGTQKDAEAMLDHFMLNFKPPEKFTWQLNAENGSFVFSVQWNVEETANAATSTHEPGRRSS